MSPETEWIYFLSLQRNGFKEQEKIHRRLISSHPFGAATAIDFPPVAARRIGRSATFRRGDALGSRLG